MDLVSLTVTLLLALPDGGGDYLVVIPGDFRLSCVMSVTRFSEGSGPHLSVCSTFASLFRTLA
eukprot:4373030-Heterocapsa_arctica.AAC.1